MSPTHIQPEVINSSRRHINHTLYFVLSRELGPLWILKECVVVDVKASITDQNAVENFLSRTKYTSIYYQPDDDRHSITSLNWRANRTDDDM